MTTLLESLARCSVTKPDALAFAIPGEGEVSWRELEDRTNRLANALLGQGVKLGDRICILGENSIGYAIAFLAALKIGAGVVPLPTLISLDALRLMIDEVEPAAIFLTPDRREAWCEISSKLARQPSTVVLLGDTSEAFASWRYDALLSRGESRRPGIPIPDESLFNIIYSSGTTGTPKGIVHSHAFRAAQVHYVADLTGACESSRVLIATPFYSNSTLTPFIMSLTLGAECIVLRKFEAADFLQICARLQPTHAAMVPVQIERVLDHPLFDRLHPERPMSKISGAAKLSVRRKREALDRWPGNLIECYGMSEGGPMTVLRADQDREHLDSVGRPHLDSDIRIIDENDRELPRGETGEIVGHSGTMMTGYYHQEELTRRQQWHDADGRIFLRTGDIGRFDEDGYLHVVDRKKEVIISGGFNIYASDLEAVLKEHPEVADASVVGVRSARWGESPVAFIVPRSRHILDAESVRAWANARLGKVQRLAAVQIRDELPRGGLGKVLKRTLRTEYEAQSPVDE